MDNSVESDVRRWATPLPAAIALIGLALLLMLAGWASYPDTAAMVFLGIAAAGILVIGCLALVRRPRLTLGPGARMRVGTFRGPVELTPGEVASIDLLDTRRLLFRSRQLLIETTEGRLLVFGQWDLGANPRVVAGDLSEAGFTVARR